jgi:hypothetical protein
VPPMRWGSPALASSILRWIGHRARGRGSPKTGPRA